MGTTSPGVWVCSNVYECSQAARFAQAKPLPPRQNRCGTCGSTATFPEFMKHALIVRCVMCRHLSGVVVADLESGVFADCLGMEGDHCRLCELEYASLEGRKPEWVRSAGLLLGCFIGGKTGHQFARELNDLCIKLGCRTVNGLLGELLGILTERRSRLLAARVRRAGELLGFSLLPPA